MTTRQARKMRQTLALRMLYAAARVCASLGVHDGAVRGAVARALEHATEEGSRVHYALLEMAPPYNTLLSEHDLDRDSAAAARAELEDKKAEGELSPWEGEMLSRHSAANLFRQSEEDLDEG